MLYYAIESERWRHQRIAVSIEGHTKIAEERLEVSGCDESEKSRVVFLQLEGMRGFRRNVQKVAWIEADESVVCEHLHLPIQTVKELGHSLVTMARDRHADGAFSEKRYKHTLAVRGIAEDGIHLVAGDHAFALAGSQNKRNRALGSGGEFR